MKIILIVHNVRSAYNVGSILRTADGLGVEGVYLTGYTPYPASKEDARLPHQAAKTGHQIHKTALGAEDSVIWHHQPDIHKILSELKKQGYKVVGLEQNDKSIELKKLEPGEKVALVVGSEIGGLDKSVLEACDVLTQIPMSGTKESFNVSVAAAIALYHLQFLA